MSATTPPTRSLRAWPEGFATGLSMTRTVPPQGRTEALVPNVVIPGVTHAGAALLAADLGRHPQVCLPASKRVDFFAPLRFGREIDADVADYNGHFANWSGQRYRIETSPVYLDGGRSMVSRISDTLPGLRVIIVLRDPADRLWTGFIDKLARGRLPRAISFETYVDRCLALRANGADRFEGNRHFRTLSAGFYVEHLPAWLDAFGRRARVVFTEDLQDEPVPQVGALFDWLGLNPGAAQPLVQEEPEPDAVPGPGPFAAAFNRRWWPVLQRASGPWRHPGPGTEGGSQRLLRQSDRVRNRVRSLYAGANRELAAMLRDRGYTALPEWLTRD